MRRQLSTITKALRNHKIEYRWKQPSKLLIQKNDTYHTITSVEQGIKLLHAWGIIPEPTPPIGAKKNPEKLTPQWH